jgi:ubiquinone biosynthesis protein
VTLPFLVIFATLVFVPASGQAEVPLPTPKDHYQQFDASQAGLKLLTEVLGELDPATQKLLLEMVSTPDASTLQKIPRSEVLSAVRSVNWQKWKAPTLEILLHHSNVLDVIPAGSKEWVPIVHDALLFFLDRLNSERLLNRLVDFAYLPPGNSRGDRILQFASGTPTFQKIGQILARNVGVEPDIQKALQTLENSLRTSTAQELVEFISGELGQQTIEKYRIQFADRILAEASVGAVIRASLQMPAEQERRDVVCKVIKPYVLKALPEELAILDELTRYFGQHRDFYELGEIPLAEMFQSIRKSMSEEIQIEDEQDNLRSAVGYYKDNSRILIPALYSFSTAHVTVMEFVHGDKISNVFPENAPQRAIMARRLSDALTFDVIFSKRDEALFHGDPHAGNVFHVANDPKDPYRIALLDWGLCGLFSRSQRMELVQLMLGIELNDAKRLQRHLGGLIEGELPQSPEKLQRLHQVIQETLQHRSKRSNFDTLEDLIGRLTKEGYVLRFNITLFIKSQVTIAGILTGLDPKLKQDDYLMKRANGLVWKEFHKHLLNAIWFPGWNSRNYRSMLSNGDITNVVMNRIGGWFGKE